MKNFHVIKFSKSLFWLSFAAGNISLFGFLFTHRIEFALAGYATLFIAGIVNLVAFLVLILAALIQPEEFENRIRAAFILLINIPIAILYTFIGTSLI